MGVGMLLNVMVVSRNAGVRRLFEKFDPGLKPILSALTLAFSYGLGLILSLLYCILYPSEILDDPLLLVHATTLKVALYSLSYNMLSYLALAEFGLVTHSLLEQGKRLFIICVFCLVAQQCPAASFSFWSGVVMIAVGGIMYSQLKRSTTNGLQSQTLMPQSCTNRSVISQRTCLHAAILTLTLWMARVHMNVHTYDSVYNYHLLGDYNRGESKSNIVFVLLGQQNISQLSLPSTLQHAISPWGADTALIADEEGLNRSLAFASVHYRWKIPGEYDWPRILSSISGDTRWKDLFCRFQLDSAAAAGWCLPDSLGTLFAHLYVAQQHLKELELAGNIYDWYAIAPLHNLYLCDMEPLASFSPHVIHTAHDAKESQDFFGLLLIPSHLATEALNYTFFFLQNPQIWNMTRETGDANEYTPLELFYSSLSLPHKRFVFPGLTMAVEKYDGLDEELLLEQVLDNVRSASLTPSGNPTICPKTNLTKEVGILLNGSLPTVSVSRVFQSCTAYRRSLASECNQSSNNTLFFFDWQGNNFGDELSPLLVQSVSSLKAFKSVDRDLSALKGTLITGIGSILHDVMPNLASVDTLHIWGSGAHERLCQIEQPAILPKVYVHAVRGPLTAACLNSVLGKANMTISSSYVYGDPGLLVPLIYPNCQKARVPTCQVCIIPHKADESLAKDDFAFQRLELLGCAKTTAESPETIIEWIVGCNKVISSSLHGIIIAEAFGIPSVWMQLQYSQMSEGSFKYLDYYLATGRHNMTPVPSLQEAIESTSANPISDDYNVWDLVDSFPYESWGGCRPQQQILPTN